MIIQDRITGRAGVAAATVLLAAGVMTVGPRLELLGAYEGPYSRDIQAAGTRNVDASALGMILGEVRTSLADFIWIKTELYAHKGVQFVPHTDQGEFGESDGDEQGHDHDGHDHEGHDHDGHDHDGHDHGEHGSDEPSGTGGGHQHDTKAATVIPPPEKDFRGFIGDIHRAVQPWGGDHEWDPTSRQILPWYVLVTKMNPKHGRGYSVGAWLLLKAEDVPDHIEEAEKFCRAGIERNPDYFPLYEIMVRVLIEKEDWEGAIDYAVRGRDIGFKRRPVWKPGDKLPWEITPTWTMSDEEDFGFLARHPVLLALRKLDDPDRARELLREALACLPYDAPLNSLARRLGVPAPADAAGPAVPAAPEN